MGKEAVLNSRNNRGVKRSRVWLSRLKPWFPITLGIILAIALTIAINISTSKDGEKISFEQPLRAPEALSVEQPIKSTEELSTAYIWQPSSLYAVIFITLTAFLSASLSYLILNRMLNK